MATATNLGPIGINQINNVFYVGGDGGFPTIQAAVDYAQKYNAGLGHVTVTHGYSGSEPISSIVRGSSGTYITDLRNTAAQNYQWNPGLGQFSPADFSQLANAHVGGLSRAYGFSPPDLSASHTAVGTGNDRTIPVVTMVNAAAPINQKLWLMAAVPGELYFSAADDNGQDHSWMQVMRTAPGMPSKVIITPAMDVAGVLTSQGSPVRTFANSGDGGGGGGGGGVNPGSQGQLSFYEADGPLVSPSLITTDVATQSVLTVPSVVQSAQANTATTSFADANAANNFSYMQELTYSMTGGGGLNLGSPWSVTQNRVDQMFHSQRGIAQIQSGFIERYAVGDTAGLYLYVVSVGGIAAGSDEGCMGLGAHVLEGPVGAGYFHGRITNTTGIGDQAPTLSNTSGSGHTIDGAFLLNISKGQLYGFWNGPSVTTYLDTGSGPTATYLNQLPVTGVLLANIPAWSNSMTYALGNIILSGANNYVSLIPGNRGYTPATSPAQWQLLPNGHIPLSAAIGIATASIPYNNAPTNQPASKTVTVNLVKIGGSFGSFSVGDVVDVASDQMPEQSILTAVTTSGTQQTLTMKLRNPSGRAIIFKGGIAGQYISHDANLAYSGMRSSYYAFGSLTGAEVIYGHNVSGALQGRLLPMAGAEAATSSGVNAGWHLYPGAEIVCNTTFNFDPTLEQNGVRWEIGDTVENPHYPEYGGTGLLLDKYQITPTSPGSSTIGLTLLFDGPGWCGTNATALVMRCNKDSTQYAADGGPVGAPGGIALMGFYSFGLDMTNAPQGGFCLSVEAPAAPVNNPNAIVNMLRVHYSAGGLLTYDPTPANQNWDISGNLSTANLLLRGGFTCAGAANFFSGRVQINGTDDYTQLVFDNDGSPGSGVLQRILAMKGNTGDSNIYYDGYLDGDHVFRTAGYSNPETRMMTIGWGGVNVLHGPLTATGGFNIDTITATGTITANGTITSASSGGQALIDITNTAASGGAAGLQITATSAHQFLFALWGVGNSAGLDGVFGLYDNTRFGLVWNTNSAGDMFFNTPLTNVATGLGCTARITAAGLIDGTAFSVAGTAGASGTFTSADSKTVTVSHGLITSIV
jgi:hypothetical protein